ncbi:MAG: c-type cytochrome [Sterolibacterium sp.]|jgi:DNA-binding beta-propeller fold protein YncE/cytochrome c553|nr:c-type cytochrome [Sterolibacterium sp.]
MKRSHGLLGWLGWLGLAVSGLVFAGTPEVYQQHCAACHGADRLGGMGPALLPENLERLRKAEALKTVREGRAATQMQGFSSVLTAEEIQQLVDWIYTPVLPAPTWTEAQMAATRIVHFAPGSLPDQPVALFDKVDMMNLFIVVEAGDHHVSVLDGDKLARIHRFPSRFALHGGPKFTPDGRYVFFASRDGWVSKFDIWNLKTVAEIRVGINTRNVAVSGDGRYVLAANYLPHTLVLLDAELKPMKVIAAKNQKGDKTSRVSAVYDAAPRKSFIAAMKDIPEVWEISYDPKAEPVYEGLVHDFRMGEGNSMPGQFYPRRTLLDDVLDDFFFDASYEHVIGASREGSKGQVVHLDARRKIADIALPGMPHLGSGISWRWQGRMVLASPNLKEGVISIIDMQNWKTIKQIPTLGPGFFMRSHEKSRYAWVDSMMSPNKDTLQVIDKEKLEIVEQLRPVAGKTLAHIEFTRDGRYALASLWENDGALIVFDAATFKEVKRIPASKPVGKYNLFNKINRSEGTSH